jgi:hypothetical protein
LAFDVDDNDHLYVVDRDRSRLPPEIVVFDSEENLLSRISLRGMRECSSLVVSMEVLYALDPSLRSIFAYDRRGNELQRWEVEGAGYGVRKIDTNRSNLLFLVGMNPGQGGIVTVFDTSLERAFTIGGRGFESDLLRLEGATDFSARRRIDDFAVAGESRLMIKTEPQRLCDFDLSTGIPVRVLNISDYATFVLLDHGICYYLADTGTLPNDSAEGPDASRIGRLNLSNVAGWSTRYDRSSHLFSIPIEPFVKTARHLLVRQSPNHLYFLDSVPEGPTTRLQRTTLYSIAKKTSR